MASSVNNASVKTSDPRVGSISPDTGKSSSSPVAGDITTTLNEGALALDTIQNKTVLQLVLSFTADAGASVAVNGNGGITITGRMSKNSIPQYAVCNMNTADPSNWTLSVGTSGGSTWRYVKGSGGGGH